MQRITITTGAGFDASGEPIDAGTLATVLAAVRGDLAATFGGYTETDTYGGWVNGKGELVTEAGKRFVILADDVSGRRDPVETAERVREAFGQESVVLEVEAVAGYFVTAPAPARAAA
jgi:hypothetical protein